MKYLRHLIWEYIKRKKGSFVLTVFLYVLSAFLAMLPAKLMQLTIDEAFSQYNERKLWLFAGLLSLSYLLRVCCSYVSGRKMILLGNSLLREIKTELFNKLVFMDLSFFTEYDSGYKYPG